MRARTESASAGFVGPRLLPVDAAALYGAGVVAEVGAPYIVDPRAVAVQFRYAFVTDREGRLLDLNPAGVELLKFASKHN